MFQKSERYCSRCAFSKYVNDEEIGVSSYICRLNPLKPVAMGIMGACSERKRNKLEQYSEKDS